MEPIIYDLSQHSQLELQLLFFFVFGKYEALIMFKERIRVLHLFQAVGSLGSVSEQLLLCHLNTITGYKMPIFQVQP